MQCLSFMHQDQSQRSNFIARWLDPGDAFLLLDWLGFGFMIQKREMDFCHWRRGNMSDFVPILHPVTWGHHLFIFKSHFTTYMTTVYQDQNKYFQYLTGVATQSHWPLSSAVQTLAITSSYLSYCCLSMVYNQSAIFDLWHLISRRHFQPKTWSARTHTHTHCSKWNGAVALWEKFVSLISFATMSPYLILRTRLLFPHLFWPWHNHASLTGTNCKGAAWVWRILPKS